MVLSELKTNFNKTTTMNNNQDNILCDTCFKELTKEELEDSFKTCSECISKMSRTIEAESTWKDDIVFS